MPSFARQTGQPCGACHTDFPGLTPFGRQFKLGGYTLGGGKFQTTPFESSGGAAAKALDSYAKKISGKSAHMPTKGPAAPADTGYHGWVPPIAMMSIFQFTHTATDLAPGDVTPYSVNDNTKLNQASIFWGGAITDHVGAFAQYTYEPLAGGSTNANPYDGQEWHWDNVDLRYSNTGKIGGIDTTYGLTATNNPSMADPWNTAPAWSFPYTDAGDFGLSPAAATMLGGAAWAQQVAGVGGYGWFNNLVYVQLSGFWSLDPSTLGTLGIDPTDGVPGKINGVAPYWRVAVQPHWGNNWWEFGTFGMTASFSPYTDQADSSGVYTFATTSQSNRFTDIGFDSQYQYQGDNYWITVRGTYFHENQSFGTAGMGNLLTGASDNSSNTLNSAKLYGSFAYGGDDRIILSGQLFDIWGSADATEYGTNNGSPNSNGFTAEVAFIPYMVSHPKLWPWANARLGLQYTWYNKFDGTTAGASDNNTLNAYLWVAM